MDSTSPVVELARRWHLARCAALRTIVADAPADTDEMTLLALASAKDPEAATRRVFDNSRIVGRGFRQYHRVDLTLVDVAEVLPALGVPCHRGGFVRAADEPAWQSATTPCAARDQVPAVCDHWREAVLGLVGGVSSSVCHTRLQSPVAGGSTCADLLHVDPQSRLRFQPLPEAVLTHLDAVNRTALRIDPGAQLAFLGLIDGAIHYTLRPSASTNGGGCGSGCGGLNVAGVVTNALRRHVPQYRAVDATPRPVLTESA